MGPDCWTLRYGKRWAQPTVRPLVSHPPKGERDVEASPLVVLPRAEARG